MQARKWAHFGVSLERFLEGEQSGDSDDVPLAVHAQMGNGKAVAHNEDEDDSNNKDEVDNVGEGNQELQQQAGPSTDAQPYNTTVPHSHWSPHCTMYTPFVYAPNLIAPAHPFSIYTLSTMPGLPCTSTLPYHTADTNAAKDKDKNLMLVTKTANETLKAKLCTEALLNVADACVAVAYEAGLWHKLQGERQGRMGRAVLHGEHRNGAPMQEWEQK